MSQLTPAQKSLIEWQIIFRVHLVRGGYFEFHPGGDPRASALINAQICCRIGSPETNDGLRALPMLRAPFVHKDVARREASEKGGGLAGSDKGNYLDVCPVNILWMSPNGKFKLYIGDALGANSEAEQYGGPFGHILSMVPSHNIPGSCVYVQNTDWTTNERRVDVNDVLSGTMPFDVFAGYVLKPLLRFMYRHLVDDNSRLDFRKFSLERDHTGQALASDAIEQVIDLIYQELKNAFSHCLRGRNRTALPSAAVLYAYHHEEVAAGNLTMVEVVQYCSLVRPCLDFHDSGHCGQSPMVPGELVEFMPPWSSSQHPAPLPCTRESVGGVGKQKHIHTYIQ